MTRTEQILWDHLRNRRLEGWKFRRQHALGAYVADFYCHAAGLVVEVDGAHHQDQVEYDEIRDAVLTARGLHVLRVKNKEVMEDLDAVLRRIAAACRALG
jgi:very-short-patch-repair endonuclease